MKDFLVGAHLKYLVFSKERVVAALGWSSAVWKLADRDNAIGWSEIEKKKAFTSCRQQH